MKKRVSRFSPPPQVRYYDRISLRDLRREGVELVEFAIEKIKEKKAEGLVFRMLDISRSVSSTMEGPERIIERRREGLGMVVIKDGKRVFVNVSDLSEESVERAIEQAIQMCEYVQADDGNIVSDDVETREQEGFYVESVEKVDLAKLKDLSLSMVEKAKGYDPRIKFIRGASVGINVVEQEVATTRGVHKRFKATAVQASAMCSAIDKSGGSMGFWWAVGRSFDDLDPLSVAEKAAKRAVDGLGAEVEKTGVYDVIFDPSAIALLFMNAFLPFSGEEIYKKSSFLKPDDIGKKLFGDKVSLVNDPTDPKLVGSMPFDSEGTNTRKFYIVENGVLKSFFHNLYSATKLGMKPTGNAVARSFRREPSIMPLNLRFEANAKREDVLSAVERGIYVTNMMGVHTLDPVSGRFSVQISGFLVENGEFKKPIRGMALSGYLKDLLSGVDMVADDYVHFGPVSGSTVLVRGMSVGGR